MDTVAPFRRVGAPAPTTSHAITDGDDAADGEAAIRRADTARAHLIDAGVDGDRVASFGAGDDRTVPATAETGVNRRIDDLLEGLGAPVSPNTVETAEGSG